MSKLINQRNIFANSSDNVEKDRKLQELNNEISNLEANEEIMMAILMKFSRKMLLEKI